MDALGQNAGHDLDLNRESSPLHVVPSLPTPSSTAVEEDVIFKRVCSTLESMLTTAEDALHSPVWVDEVDQELSEQTRETTSDISRFSFDRSRSIRRRNTGCSDLWYPAAPISPSLPLSPSSPPSPSSSSPSLPSSSTFPLMSSPKQWNNSDWRSDQWQTKSNELSNVGDSILPLPELRQPQRFRRPKSQSVSSPLKPCLLMDDDDDDDDETDTDDEDCPACQFQAKEAMSPNRSSNPQRQRQFIFTGSSIFGTAGRTYPKTPLGILCELPMLISQFLLHLSNFGSWLVRLILACWMYRKQFVYQLISQLSRRTQKRSRTFGHVSRYTR